jgi:hypothetical protein
MRFPFDDSRTRTEATLFEMDIILYGVSSGSVFATIVLPYVPAPTTILFLVIGSERHTLRVRTVEVLIDGLAEHLQQLKFIHLYVDRMENPV